MNTTDTDLYDIYAQLDRIIALLEAMQPPRRNSRATHEPAFTPFDNAPNPLPSFTITTTCGSDGASWGKPTNCS